MREPFDLTAPAPGGYNERLDRVLGILERARRADPPRAGEGARHTGLAYATQLLEILESIAPASQQEAGAGRWERGDALMARVTFQIYDRAVRELRAVALDARAHLERAEAVLAEAREFARRRRRRAKKVAAKHQRHE